jgi:hypothetical protein
MTTGQKIYEAVEQFHAGEADSDQFRTIFRGTLVDHGAPAANAEQLAKIAAETLRDRMNSDYHLGLAQIITHHSEFDRALGGNPEATQALHKYMSFYIDYAEMQQAKVIN